MYAWLWAAVFAVFGLPIIAGIIVALPREAAWRLIGRIARFALAMIGIRVRLGGAEYLQAGRNYVVMGNHVSFLDIFLFAAAFPRPVIAVEKRENFRLPIYGWLVARWGNVPIHREDRDEAIKAMDEARARVGAIDCSLVVMPEGTRTRTGEMGPFKRGGFHLAVQSGLSILPFTFIGAYDVHPTGTWRFRPGTVALQMHPPIDPSHYGIAGLDQLMGAVRDAIA
ncbi:MAG: 1-acyl-sn-glycerol-3-phosphate acyltransferase [Candidatus Sericytochromatia bacterium]|uniref:1-acyl-sn-glycerol-3-phosphate acyltransferase n=1 Tax=Candidatus Tanganyikabacteria bacterium TaxID=2961651 RepID=A0A937X421_9BACT|nr:1-acyl-sn-glycerol-3-phosphate acyltransferase [Candidatus Tanganyikabacteria bacterium]